MAAQRLTAVFNHRLQRSDAFLQPSYLTFAPFAAAGDKSFLLPRAVHLPLGGGEALDMLRFLFTELPFFILPGVNLVLVLLNGCLSRVIGRFYRRHLGAQRFQTLTGLTPRRLAG